MYFNSLLSAQTLAVRVHIPFHIDVTFGPSVLLI